MNRLSSTRRSRRIADSVAVPAAGFGWDRALMATMRHSTLACEERLLLVPLESMAGAGARDRLSLVTQFAAHQAMLRFAGITDCEFDPVEWRVEQKRGSELRLVRIAARRCDPSLAPPSLSIVQQFAELMRTGLEAFRQSWARPDQIYAEAWCRLAHEPAHDRTWSTRSGWGSIDSPGPEGLRLLHEEPGVWSYADARCLESIERWRRIDGLENVIEIRGGSPLERYSALGELAVDRGADAATLAEEILARTSRAPTLFVVTQLEAFDEYSRRVVEILTRAGTATWLVPGEANALPRTRWFVAAPRLEAAERLLAECGSAGPRNFVESDAFASYLAARVVPVPSSPLPSVSEPNRSYLGVLALLGRRISREVALRCLAEFLFHGELETLEVEGITVVDREGVEFVSESARAEAAQLIPASSRPAIARAAAVHATGIDAAMLWLDAGDTARATEQLEAAVWDGPEATIEALERMPRSVLTPGLASRLATALVDSGRYHDAREVSRSCAPDEAEVLLARVERRTGDYVTALSRVERLSDSFDAALLRAELLRLLDREAEARTVLDASCPVTDEQRSRHAYERSLHGEAVALPAGHYYALRAATYQALDQENFEEAQRLATESRNAARCVTERVDSSLDRVFSAFAAGAWDDARVFAVEALQEVEETQGDRAAGGILFTLAYLAADEGQWAHAEQRIERLRHFYRLTADEKRLEELHLLTAHLAFSRGRFTQAERSAKTILARAGHHGQIREAAALIVDEVAWLKRRDEPLLSSGRSGNVELTRRHERLLAGNPPTADDGSVRERLCAFRRAVRDGDRGTAQALASALDLCLDDAPKGSDVEVRLLRAAATRDYPFAPADFDVPWCFATCNRLGHWSVIGSESLPPEVAEGSELPPDWLRCGERGRLYFEGSGSWAPEGREALAAIFRERAENHRLRRTIEQEVDTQQRVAAVDGIVGQSPAIRELELSLAKIARRDVAVCILGESGTGKELVARALHSHSSRRSKPFTAVNCAALPENLIESELFGHVRGAFTGADRDRPGLIESTEGGTLFLDEVGELPLVAQAKLLRFLQEGEYRRVGEVSSRSADVRIVSATNRRLDAAVEQGEFRDDLYYRIRGVELTLPPLRDRGGDILLLASHFLAEEKARHRSGPSSFSGDVESIFSVYSWPGNVRELQNAIRAAHAMAGEARQIEVDHLPARLRAKVPGRAPAGSYQDSVARFKRELIERSLVQAKGNQNRAAAMLRISRQALAYQIRELGILVRAH